MMPKASALPPSRPRERRGRHRLARLVARLFAVDKTAHPHLEVDERPRTFRVVGPARTVFRDETRDLVAVEEPARGGARREHVVVHDVTVRAAEPAPDGDGEAHLRPRQYLLG